MKKPTAVLLLVAISIATSLPSFAQQARMNSPIQKIESVPTNDFMSTTAFSDGTGVLVAWQMNVEDTIGFYVYRIDAKGNKNIVSDRMVAGNGLGSVQKAEANRYSVFDDQGAVGDVYEIEAFSKKGTSTMSSAFSPQYTNSLAAMSKPIQVPPSLVIENNPSYSKEVVRQIEANATAADLGTHRYVVSQPGVKIGVKKAGLYRILNTQLQIAGFDTTGNSANWQLYTDGVQQAIKVGPSGSYIEFLGTGVDTLQSDTRAYFLINGNSAGKRMVQQVARPNPATVPFKAFNDTAFRTEKTNYVDDVVNGDASNYWGRVIVSTVGPAFTFNLSGVDMSAANVSVVVRFQGYSLGKHSVNVVLNGNTLPSATGSLHVPFAGIYNLPPSALVEGTNTLQMNANGPGGDIGLFDSIEISYARRFVADQNALTFYTSNSRTTKLEGFSSSNVRLFETTFAGNPAEVTNLDIRPGTNGFDVNMPAYRAGAYYAVDDSAALTPDTITQNNPTMYGVPDAGANLVIVSNKAFLTQAETWANYRRGQGFSVKVIDVEEIYDEFNYGTLDSGALRSFFAYTKTNWVTPPQYVLLIGDATYDPRNYQGGGANNFIPTQIVSTVYTEAPSDEYLTDFDNDGLAEMAVGRIPARTTAMVDTAFAKTTLFESNPGSHLSSGAIFAFDEPNGYDFEGMSGRMRDQLPAGTPSTMIHRFSTNAQTNLISGINNGPFVVNYSGHGATGLWAAVAFFSNNNIPQLTNSNQPSLFTMLTCLNGYFIGLPDNSASLAERLLTSPSGGSVASWASTGKTTPDIQEIMGTRFFLKLGSETIPRLGDLIMDAKTVIGGGTDVRLSWVLLGDPMLKVNSGNGNQPTPDFQASPFRKNR